MLSHDTLVYIMSSVKRKGNDLVMPPEVQELFLYATREELDAGFGRVLLSELATKLRKPDELSWKEFVLKYSLKREVCSSCKEQKPLGVSCKCKLPKWYWPWANSGQRKAAYSAYKYAISRNRLPESADILAINQFYKECPVGHEVAHRHALHSLENLYYRKTKNV